MSLYCAVCGRRFEPDQNHVYVTGETRRMDDRNDTDEFAFHPECWRLLTGGWMDPA